MSNFKASENRLSLLLGANVAGDLKLKPVFIYLGSLRITVNLRCLCSINETRKLRWQHICSQHEVLNILNQLWKHNAQKRIPFKIWRELTMYLVTQELWWRSTVRFMLFSCLLMQHMGFPDGSRIKNLPALSLSSWAELLVLSCLWTLELLFLGLWTQKFIPMTPWFSASWLRLNSIISFHESPACRDRIAGLLSLHNHVSQSL